MLDKDKSDVWGEKVFGGKRSWLGEFKNSSQTSSADNESKREQLFALAEKP